MAYTVFSRTCLNRDVIFGEQIRDVHKVLRITVPIADVMQATAASCRVKHEGDVMRKRGNSRPRRNLGAIARHDVFT